jgi:hypothetical protein
MGVPGDEKENIKHIKGRIAEFSPSLQKNTNLYTQKAQKTPKRINPKIYIISIVEGDFGSKPQLNTYKHLKDKLLPFIWSDNIK